MSEHDEPKTALARLIYAVTPDRQPWDGEPFDFDDRRNLSGHNRGVALRTADVLLAEGYTTSPAPEAAVTVEWEYGVDYTHMVGTRASNGWTDGYTSRAHADQIAAERLDGKVFRRRPAGPWVPVDRAADEHEGDS